MRMILNLNLLVPGCQLQSTLYPLKARRLESPGLGEGLYKSTAWYQPDWRPIDLTSKKQMIGPPISYSDGRILAANILNFDLVVYFKASNCRHSSRLIIFLQPVIHLISHIGRWCAGGKVEGCPVSAKREDEEMEYVSA